MRVDSATLASLLQIQARTPAGQPSGLTGGGLAGADRTDLSAAGLGLAAHAAAPPALSEALAARISATIKRQDPSLFAKLDTDRDGALSALELARSAPPSSSPIPRFTLPKLSEAQAVKLGKAWRRTDRALFVSLDADRNGRFSSAEVAKGAAKISAYFDHKISGGLKNVLA